MPSHSYSLGAAEAMRAVLAPVVGMLLWAALLPAVSRLAWLPRSELASDPDHALLALKSQLCRAKSDARIVLLGDSSCLTGVDALSLSGQLQEEGPAVNLALIISLGFDVYADAWRRFTAANPIQARQVVLLVSPQKLKNENASDYHANIWRDLARESGSTSPLRIRESENYFTSWITSLRQCWRLVWDEPLRGAAREFYGFLSLFRKHAMVHHGSLIDPGIYRAPFSPDPMEYDIAPSLRQASRTLREAIPADVVFVAGLTPVPEGHMPAEFVEVHRALLAQWNEWLQADVLLTNLPARLPDVLFATGAHLNERGQQLYTQLLAAELARLRAKPPP